MELNHVLFPAPKAKYQPENLQGEVIYIPRYFKFSQPYTNYLNSKYKELKKKERLLKEQEQVKQTRQPKVLSDLNKRLQINKQKTE